MLVEVEVDIVISVGFEAEAGRLVWYERLLVVGELGLVVLAIAIGSEDCY